MKNLIKRILKEEVKKSNFELITNYFINTVPPQYGDKVKSIFEQIKEYIQEKNFNIKVLNNCMTGFNGVRTKNYIIICSPTVFKTIADFIYILFHEIRHEIQMGVLKQTNPLSGDIENFDELYTKYWEMEMDSHEFAVEWVEKFGKLLNLPGQYYKLSPHIVSYPSMSHMVRNEVEKLNKIIKDYKKEGQEYSDISDLPIIKKHLDNLENLF